MLNVAVLGASGYVGAELTQILAAHPQVSGLQLFHSGEQPGAFPFHHFQARSRGQVAAPVEPFSQEKLSDFTDVVFLCTPHEFAAEHTPELLKKAKVVIDLSAGFRFSDASIYQQYYGFTHPNPDLLGKAVYGLPELNADGLNNASLIGCAGCYVTAASLAIAPLSKNGLLKSGALPIISATSGVSGAGRKAQVSTHFCEVSLTPYGVQNHRHQPEIEKNVGVPVVFQPHLGNYKRGILASVYLFTNNGVTATDIDQALNTAYENQPMVRLLGAGQYPAVQHVENTPFCDLGWRFDEARGQLTVFSALDNLLKGAASQAVQCFNIRFGFDMRTGLLPLEHA